MAVRKKRTRADVLADIEKYQKELDRVEAMETLPRHASIKKVREAVTKASQETGVSELQVRVSEVVSSDMDLTEFLRELKGHVEDWVKGNATYRNPSNEEEVWYSPDGKGNPPKWLVNLIGSKPKNKSGKEMEAWLKKAEKYRVRTEGTKKAA